MFKRSQRFSFRKGVPKSKIITPLFVLRFEKSDAPKYAVVSGKIVSKKAVHRNRIKRVFTHILQEELKKNPAPYTLIFFLRRPYTEYSKSAIISELESVFSQLNSIS